MSRSGRGRTEPFSRAQGRQRLDYARKCHESAELVGSDHGDTYAAKVAVSLYVAAWLGEHPGARAVWTDDDITPRRLRGLPRHRLLALAPDPSVGLTVEHLGRIEAWTLGMR